MYTEGIKVALTEEEIKEALDWGAKNKDSFWKVIKPYLFGKWGISDKPKCNRGLKPVALSFSVSMRKKLTFSLSLTNSLHRSPQIFDIM